MAETKVETNGGIEAVEGQAGTYQERMVSQLNMLYEDKQNKQYVIPTVKGLAKKCGIPEKRAKKVFRKLGSRGFIGGF